MKYIIKCSGCGNTMEYDRKNTGALPTCCMKRYYIIIDKILPRLESGMIDFDRLEL